MDRTPDRADPRAHLDLDRLADAAEGLLDETAERAVDEHLSDCAVCRERAAALADVSGGLRELPDPPLPPDLAARFATALDVERAGEPGRSQPTLTVLADRRQRRADRWRVTSAAAIVVALVGGIGFATLHNGSGEGGDGSGGSGASAGRGGVSSSFPQLSAGPLVRHSGTDYTADTLRAAVPALSGRAPAAVRGEGDQPAGSAADAQLRACSRNAGADPSRLLAADYARFDHSPSLVLVFEGNTPSRAQVYVLPRDCASNPGLIPRAVLFTDVPTASPSR